MSIDEPRASAGSASAGSASAGSASAGSASAGTPALDGLADKWARRWEQERVVQA